MDDSLGQPPERLRIEIDQENMEFHGVQEQALYDTIDALIGGVTVGYSQRGLGINPVEIAVRLPKSGLLRIFARDEIRKQAKIEVVE